MVPGCSSDSGHSKKKAFAILLGICHEQMPNEVGSNGLKLYTLLVAVTLQQQIDQWPNSSDLFSYILGSGINLLVLQEQTTWPEYLIFLVAGHQDTYIRIRRVTVLIFLTKTRPILSSCRRPKCQLSRSTCAMGFFAGTARSSSLHLSVRPRCIYIYFFHLANHPSICCRRRRRHRCWCPSEARGRKGATP
jgi:hypothetical protein